MKDPNYAMAYNFIRRSTSEPKEYTYRVDGIDLLCHPQVWSPKYSGSGLFMFRHADLSSGMSVLDIGTATGLIAIFMANRGASRVLAIDHEPTAIQIASKNIRELKLQGNIEVRLSDVYENIGNERFDRGFWNAPNYPIAPDPSVPLQSGIFDKDFQTSRRVLLGWKDHSTDRGKLHFACSDNADISPFEATFTQAGLKIDWRDEEDTGKGYTRFLYHLVAQ